MFKSSLGILEYKKGSDRHTMSKLLFVIKASTNGTLIKWAAKPYKFQWQDLMLDDRFGSGLISKSPDNKSRRYLKLFTKYIIVNI